MSGFALRNDLPFEVEFAERTIYNLELIDRIAAGTVTVSDDTRPFPLYSPRDRAFEATQLINSLTGLLLFPRERGERLGGRYEHPVETLPKLGEFTQRVGQYMTWANQDLLPRLRSQIRYINVDTGVDIVVDSSEANLGQIIIRLRNAVAHSRRSNEHDAVGGFYVYPQQSRRQGIVGFSFQSQLNPRIRDEFFEVTLTLADIKALIYLYVKELYAYRSDLIAAVEVPTTV